MEKGSIALHMSRQRVVAHNADAPIFAVFRPLPLHGKERLTDSVQPEIICVAAGANF